jgi:ACR3 family arsenite efflux pump ArsB
MPAPAFVSALGGDVELAVLSIIATFFASIIVMPTYAYLILHSFIKVPINLLVASIIEYIVFPFTIGRIVRRVLEGSEHYPKMEKVLGVLSLIAMYILIFIIFGNASKVITSLGSLLALFMILVYVYYGIRFGLAWEFGKVIHMDLKERIAFLFSASVNGALGMAISIGAYGPKAAAGAVLAGPLGVLVEMALLVKLLSKRIEKSF